MDKGLFIVGLCLLTLLVPSLADGDSRIKRESSGETPRKIMEDLLQGYDKDEVPRIDDEPAEVQVGMYANNLELDEKNRELRLTCYLRQRWSDSRLAHTHEEMLVPRDLQDQVWKPDVFFRNEESVDKPEEQLMKLNSSGSLFYVQRRRSRFSCDLQLQKFPFDTQTCSIYMESFSHTVGNGYTLSFLDHPFEVNNKLNFPNSALVKYLKYDCSQTYTGGTFPCAELRLMFRRAPGYHVKVFYFPTALMVLAAWASFWMTQRSTLKLRGFLCVVFLLFTLAELQFACMTAPQVSYITAFDVWMFVAFLLVFCAFMEYVIVYFIVMNRSSLHPKDPSELPFWTTVVDKVCRWIYFIFFLLFLIVYFVVYS